MTLRNQNRGLGARDHTITTIRIRFLPPCPSRHRRTLPQRWQDQRGCRTDRRFTGIQLDGDENHAVWSRHLLGQWRAMSLRDRRPQLGHIRGTRPLGESLTPRVFWWREQPVPCGYGPSRAAWLKRCPQSVAARSKPECNSGIEQHSEVPASGSISHCSRPGYSGFQEISTGIHGSSRRRHSAPAQIRKRLRGTRFR